MGHTARMRQTPRILITSCLRNEGPYLIDWLAHMIGAGVADFRLYSNDCTDGTDAMLDMLQEAGVLTHCRHAPAPGESIQWHAFRDAWKSDQRKAAEWIMACDVDEYPNIKLGQGRFLDLLDALPDGTDAVVLPWRLFGDSGQRQFTDAPVTERFTQSMTPACMYPVATTFFKSLVRCDGPFNQLGVHRPSQKAADRAGVPNWVDGSLRPMPRAFAERAKRLSLYGMNCGRDHVEMNHYSVRSAEEFLSKRARGLPNHRERPLDLSYWVDRNFNTVDNTSIAFMSAATAEAKERLLTIPGLAEAHAASIAHAADVVGAQVQDPVGFDLLSHIVVAGGSDELPAGDAQRLYQVFNAVRHP